jgi:hypothetical protein
MCRRGVTKTEVVLFVSIELVVACGEYKNTTDCGLCVEPIRELGESEPLRLVQCWKVRGSA